MKAYNTILLLLSGLICFSCRIMDGDGHWDGYLLAPSLIIADKIIAEGDHATYVQNKERNKDIPCPPSIRFYFGGSLFPEWKAFRDEVGDGCGWYYHPDSPTNTTVNRFTKVTLTSEQRFNDIQPGQPLDHIASLFASSAYPVIIQQRSGDGHSDQTDVPYGEVKIPNGNIRLYHDYYWFAKHLSELTQDDVFLLYKTFYIVFDELPDIKQQTLTLTFSDDSGNEISLRSDFSFPE